MLNGAQNFEKTNIYKKNLIVDCHVASLQRTISIDLVLPLIYAILSNVLFMEEQPVKINQEKNLFEVKTERFIHDV